MEEIDIAEVQRSMLLCVLQLVHISYAVPLPHFLNICSSVGSQAADCNCMLHRSFRWRYQTGIRSSEYGQPVICEEQFCRTFLLTR